MIPLIRLMRLDKPIGTLLLLWPVLWALWLANGGLPSFKLLIIFILGTLIMRTAGCVVNDIFDRKFDSQVERTKLRPLAQGEVSVTTAWITFFILMLLAFLLVLQLNIFTIFLACVAGVLTILYPLCKRVTYLPQLILGITFNSGILLAYSASINQLPPIAWLLFLISVIWTMGYDTLYAMADKPDDIKIGLKSTAVLFGQFDLLMTHWFYILFFIGILSIGHLEHFKLIFYIFTILSIIWTYYHLFNARAKTSLAYFKVFLSNNITGMLIFLGILFALY